MTQLGAFGGSGISPYGSVIADAAGNLYGTAVTGGLRPDASGYGDVWRYDAVTGRLTSIVDFTFSQGAYPMAGLIADAAGNFYGTTSAGGTDRGGTVFRIDAISHNLTTLANLVGQFNTLEGTGPHGNLLLDAAGNLFGTTMGCGSTADTNCGTRTPGTVFRIDAGTNQFTTLVTFDASTGANPIGGVVADALGNLYGTTSTGGTGGTGALFRLSDTGFVTAASLLPTPEPATWAMMVLGFGFTGAAMRRRRPLARRPGDDSAAV